MICKDQPLQMMEDYEDLASSNDDGDDGNSDISVSVIDRNELDLAADVCEQKEPSLTEKVQSKGKTTLNRAITPPPKEVKLLKFTKESTSNLLKTKTKKSKSRTLSDINNDLYNRTYKTLQKFELMSKKNKSSNMGVLTASAECYVNNKRSPPSQYTESTVRKANTIFMQTLNDTTGRFYDTNVLFDVLLTCHDKQYRAHSFLLASCSDYIQEKLELSKPQIVYDEARNIHHPLYKINVNELNERAVELMLDIIYRHHFKPQTAEMFTKSYRYINSDDVQKSLEAMGLKRYFRGHFRNKPTATSSAAASELTVDNMEAIVRSIMQNMLLHNYDANFVNAFDEFLEQHNVEQVIEEHFEESERADDDQLLKFSRISEDVDEIFSILRQKLMNVQLPSDLKRDYTNLYGTLFQDGGCSDEGEEEEDEEVDVDDKHQKTVTIKNKGINNDICNGNVSNNIVDVVDVKAVSATTAASSVACYVTAVDPKLATMSKKENKKKNNGDDDDRKNDGSEVAAVNDVVIDDGGCDEDLILIPEMLNDASEGGDELSHQMFNLRNQVPGIKAPSNKRMEEDNCNDVTDNKNNLAGDNIRKRKILNHDPTDIGVGVNKLTNKFNSNYKNNHNDDDDVEEASIKRRKKKKKNKKSLLRTLLSCSKMTPHNTVNIVQTNNKASLSSFSVDEASAGSMAHSSQTFTINDDPNPNPTNRSVNMQSIMEQTATTSTSSETTSLTTTSSGLTNEINDDSSSSFMCQVCGKMLLSLQKLQLHLGKTHCEKRKYMCPHCHKLFNERGNRHRHIRVVHYKERNYLCDLCGQSFGQVSTLHQHRNSCQTGRRSLAKCHFCKFKVNNSLKSNRMMVDHYEEVHGIELLHCSNCPDIYYSLESYNKHLKDFLYEASECKSCDIQFTNQCSMRVHSCELTDAVTKHVCGVCCKSFLTSTSFKYHQRTHDGQKPHACKICDSRFRQAAHLKIHQLKHSIVRSQKCLLCKKTYKARNDLKLHYRNVHKIILPKYIVGDITVDDLSKGEPVDDDDDDGGGFVNVGGRHDDVDTVLAYMTCDNDDDGGADKKEKPENENSCNAGDEDEDDDDNDFYGG